MFFFSDVSSLRILRQFADLTFAGISLRLVKIATSEQQAFKLSAHLSDHGSWIAGFLCLIHLFWHGS